MGIMADTALRLGYRFMDDCIGKKGLVVTGEADLAGHCRIRNDKKQG